MWHSNAQTKPKRICKGSWNLSQQESSCRIEDGRRALNIVPTVSRETVTKSSVKTPSVEPKRHLKRRLGKRTRAGGERGTTALAPRTTAGLARSELSGGPDP